MYFGIDFGTCFSSVAVLGPKNDPIDVTFKRDVLGTGMPSVLAIDNGRPVCGFTCEQRNTISDARKIRNLKKQIRTSKDGDPLDRPPDESAAVAEYRDYTRSDLLGFYLQNLLESAISGIRDQGSIDDDDRIDGITITVPVGLGYQKTMRTSYVDTLIAQLETVLGCKQVKDLLPQQGRVGKVKITTLAEPVAAALAYLEQSPRCRRMLRDKPKGKIIVVDIGGGTADLTAIGYEVLSGKKRYEVLAEEGDLSLGGNDWDDALYALVNDKLFHGTLPVPDENYRKRIQALNQLKHLLSDDDEVIYTDPVTQATLRITRADFEKCSRPLVERLQQLARKTIDAAGGIGQINKIILVGGASQMPMVRSGIAELYTNLGGDIFDSYLPHKAIAFGAALYCNMKDGIDVSVSLKAQATYGTWHLDTKTMTSIVDNHIFKGQAFDEDGSITKETVSYYPVYNNQKFVTWKIYESDSIEEKAPLTDAYHFNGMEFMIDIPQEFWKQNCATKYEHWVRIKLYDSGRLELSFFDSNGPISDARIQEKIIPT